MTTTKALPETGHTLPQTPDQLAAAADELEAASGSLRTILRSGFDKDVVALAGELDVASAPDLTATIATLLAGGRINIVVDLGAVTFFDVAAIRALTTATDDVFQAGGSLWVTHNARCMRVLMITDQLHRLNVTDTRVVRSDQGVHVVRGAF